jgi:ribosomal protein L29
MTTGIYALFDARDGACLYVGQSIDVDGRWYHHRHSLSKGKHHTHTLQEYYDSVSQDIEMRVLEECVGEELYAKETEWYNKLKPLFWGRKPGKSWRWHHLAPDVIERINDKKHERSKLFFDEINILWGQKVVRLYSEGNSSDVIPTLVPVSYAYVLKILKHHGVVFRSTRDTVGFEYSRGKTDEELKAELLELRKQEMSWPQIAKLWKCGDTTMKELTKRLGLYEAPPVFALADMTDDEIKARIVELEAQKLKTGQIARTLGIGKTTYFRRLHKYFPERFMEADVVT